MAGLLRPRRGQWYRDDSDQYFEVVAVDEDEALIEIQYFDGAVEEVDFDSWNQLGIVESAAPEDWSGPFDDLERDDFGDTELIRHSSNLDDELDNMD
ncbi:MAG: hypothetical protein HQL49_06310 [Gammaproteobacteria bacterium]|nr:hypothetical protein [Gammaproteobacteria bacterium]